MSESRKSPTRLRIDVSDLALAMFSIVVAILLAFALNSWHDGWARHGQERTALRAIRDELRTNRDDMVALLPLSRARSRSV